MSGEKETTSDFERRVDSIINDGVAAMCFAIGSQKGFFEVIAEFKDTFTLYDLAQKTNCKPVMVKFWLYAMTAANVLEMPSEGQFKLPPHRRDVVTSPFSPVHTKAKILPPLGARLPDLMKFMDTECNEAMDSFLRDIANEDRERSLTHQIPAIIASVPGLQQRLEKGISVLDIGSNKGDLLIPLAKKYPNSRFTGIDAAVTDTLEAVERAKSEKLTNLEFQLQDALNLPVEWQNKFDYIITINTLHHLPDGPKGCAEMKRVLAEGGYLSVIEIRKEDTDAENMSQSGAAMFYFFNMFALAMGHRHDKKDEGGKVTLQKDMTTGSGETSGGDHSMNTLSLLRGFIEEGGFEKIKLGEAPRSDFLDQVHFLCQK